MSDLFHLTFSKYLFCHYSIFIREHCVNFFTHTFHVCFLRIKTQRMVIIFISKFTVLKVWFCSQDRQIIDHYLVMLRKTAYWKAAIILLLLSALSAMWFCSPCHQEREPMSHMLWLKWVCWFWAEPSRGLPHFSWVSWNPTDTLGEWTGLTCQTDTLGIP